MSKGKVRLVTFDVFNTLIKVRGSVGKIYSQTAAKYNLRFDESTLNRCFRASFKEQTRLCPVYGTQSNVSTKAWWDEVVKKTFTTAGFENTTESREKTLRELSNDLFRDFGTASHWQTFPESASVLEALVEKKLRLGVISNVDERLEKILEDLKLRSFFNFVICSSVVGLSKPSPKIFRLALSKSGVTAEETLHIGDDVDLDYWPALATGMKAFLVDRTGKVNGGNGDHILKDLTQLLLHV